MGRGDAQRSAESDAWLVAGCDGMDKMGKQRDVCLCLRAYDYPRCR